MSSAPALTNCPCGSGALYSTCCQPLHLGAPAATPEALMRSRYSAFVLRNAAYVLASWDARTRPESMDFDEYTQWLGLSVHSAQEQGDAGEVCFSARFKEQDGYYELAETSRFDKNSDGFWRYVDGNAQFQKLSIGRNDDCPCGSAKKFKKCCG